MNDIDKKFLKDNEFLIGFFLGMLTGIIEFAIVFGYLMR